jgi:hypothetical protein
MPFHRRLEPTTRTRLFRTFLRIIGVGTVVAVPILAIVAFATLGSFLNPGIAERKHLDPIPIAAQACPYVKLMHEAANRFQIAYPILGMSLDSHQHQLTWSQTRQRLGRATDVLDVAIAAGTPHFPKRVRDFLEVARVDVVAGRRQLAVATNAQDFSTRTTSQLHDGRTAFGFAGDLIGHRCGVELRADDGTMLYPFMTSTSATRPPSTSARGSRRSGRP